MSLALTLSQFWETVQHGLFVWLREELGELSAKQQQLVKVLELVRIESFVSARRGLKGRPLEDRKAIASLYGESGLQPGDDAAVIGTVAE